MATAFFISDILLLVVFFLAQIAWKAKKAELTQTIDYLNRNLTDENLTTFSVTRSFEAKETLNASTPRIIYDDRNLKNPFYKRAIGDYESGKKNHSLISAVCLIISLIISTILMICYPEFISELFS